MIDSKKVTDLNVGFINEPAIETTNECDSDWDDK